MFESKVNKEKSLDGKSYPKLMINENNMETIVLMVSHGCGVKLVSNQNPPIGVGEYLSKFSMPAFIDFDGEITLSNSQ